MRKEKCLYNVIVGDYDVARGHQALIPNDYDHVLLTDSISNFPASSLEHFDKIVKIPVYVSPTFTQRRAKILPHDFLPEYDSWLYYDGNLKLQGRSLLDVPDVDVGISPHAKRDCIYGEALACMEQRKGDPSSIGAIVREARNEYEHPERWGLWRTRMLVRQNTKGVRRLMETWWRLVEAFCLRDQISLPIAIRMLGMRNEVEDIPKLYARVKLFHHKHQLKADFAKNPGKNSKIINSNGKIVSKNSREKENK